MPPKKQDQSIGALFRGIRKKANDPKNNPKPKSSNSLVIKPKKKANGKKKNGKKSKK